MFVNFFILSLAATLNQSSQKRPREYEPCDVGAKKQCHRGVNQQAHMATPTAGIPSSTAREASSGRPSGFSARTTGNQLCGDPLCDLNSSTKCKSQESSCSSVLPNSYTYVKPPMGVRQAFIKLTPNRCVEIIEVRPDSDDNWLKEYLNRNRDNCLNPTLNTSFSIKNSPKGMDNPQHQGLNSCMSGPPQHDMSVLSAKYSSRGTVEEKHSNPSRKASKPSSGSVSSSASAQRRSASTRRCSVLLDDISDLFTPDPLIYRVKSANPNLDGGIKSSPVEACPSLTLSKPLTATNNKVAESSNVRIENRDTGSSRKASPVVPLIFSPVVILERIQVETKVGQPKTESVKSTEKRMLNASVSACASESDTMRKVSPIQYSETPPQENQAGEESKQQRTAYPLDMELDLDLRFALDWDPSQSSNSSEEEEKEDEEEALFSLQEMMNPAKQPLVTTEKELSPEPSTHGYQSESETVSWFFFLPSQVKV